MVAEKDSKIIQKEGSADDKEAGYELRIDAHEITMSLKQLRKTMMEH